MRHEKQIKITTSRKWEAGSELVNPVLVRVKGIVFAMILGNKTDES